MYYVELVVIRVFRMTFLDGWRMFILGLHALSLMCSGRMWRDGQALSLQLIVKDFKTNLTLCPLKFLWMDKWLLQHHRKWTWLELSAPGLMISLWAWLNIVGIGSRCNFTETRKDLESCSAWPIFVCDFQVAALLIPSASPGSSDLCTCSCWGSTGWGISNSSNWDLYFHNLQVFGHLCPMEPVHLLMNVTWGVVPSVSIGLSWQLCTIAFIPVKVHIRKGNQRVSFGWGWV